MKEARDILSLFEALNNHEVFTPPRVARDVISLLPIELWTNPKLKVLDPCAKSGVFLREIFFRLVDGLHGYGAFTADDGITYDLNNRQELINHILKNMLFGIATSELTGYVTRRTLYGVMEANTDKQIAAIECFEKSASYKDWSEQERLDFIGRNKFNEYYDHSLFGGNFYKGYESEGNIFYPTNEVRKKVLEDGGYTVEDTYYPFIESSTKHRLINHVKAGKMKFDVIIGNPPYQVNTSEHSKQAKPIYNLFVEQAIRLNPSYVVMITPSRWFTGGMGLSSFRNMMMTSRKINRLVDFPNSKDCFPGVSISGGVSYFVWDKNFDGCCEFTSMRGGVEKNFRNDFTRHPIVIRHLESVEILEKIAQKVQKYLAEKVSPINAFNIASSFRGDSSPRNPKDSVEVIHSRGTGFTNVDNITNGLELLPKYKVVVSRTVAEHANEPSKDGKFKVLARVLILEPGQVCTHSYLVVSTFDTYSDAAYCKSYLMSKLVRFLILQTLTGIDLSRERFKLVPDPTIFRDISSDEEIYRYFDLSKESIDFIDEMIKPMEE